MPKATRKLYRPGPRPGSRVLVALPGQELDAALLAELEALPVNGGRPPARPEPEHDAVEAPAPRTARPAAGPTRAELLVEAKRRGLVVSARATRAELLALLAGGDR